MHKVLKAFDYSHDGVTVEHLKVGEKREIRAELVEGLVSGEFLAVSKPAASPPAADTKPPVDDGKAGKNGGGKGKNAAAAAANPAGETTLDPDAKPDGGGEGEGEGEGGEGEPTAGEA